MRKFLVAGTCLLACFGTLGTASAGWPFHHHHHYRYHSYPTGSGSSSTFSGASGEYYVVRPSAERVRYYAVSEGALLDGGLFTSSKSVEERVRAEMERAEAAKVLQREAFRAAFTEAFQAAGRPAPERVSVPPGGAPAPGAAPVAGAPAAGGVPSTDEIYAQAQKIYEWRKSRVEQLEKELAILKSIELKFNPQPAGAAAPKGGAAVPAPTY